MPRFINIIFFLFLSIFAFFEVEKTWAAGLDELDIVVIGGGLAGLTASREFQRNGQTYDLFEALDAFGGRAREGGGEWIESDHVTIQGLAKEHGVSLQTEPYDKPIRCNRNGTELSQVEMIPILKSTITKLSAAVSKGGFCTDEGKYKSLIDILPDLTSDENLLIRAFVTLDLGLPPEEIQASIVVDLKKDLGDFLTVLRCHSWGVSSWVLNQFAYQYRVKGGMNTLIEAMRKQLDEEKIHLNHELKRISKDEKGKFHLFFNTGNSELYEVRANAVITTIPFSVLRHIELDESLGLTDLHRNAIQTLTYGANGKIQTLETMPESFRYQLNTQPPSTLWNSVSGKGTTIFLGGSEGENLDENSARPLAESIFGRTIDTPIDVYNWFKNPFARGSYPARGLYNPSLDDPSKVLKGLRACTEPVDLFYFAGDHTLLENVGYMESAVQSGIVAAQDLCEKYRLRTS
ncbi:MAG: FAD-dependent oxidoreductase [Alphaproteobacteria bacterium]|nr:FAD-dependent oxidoreductase [Alphaproteobacteria bacterium]